MKVGILTFPHAPSLGAMLQMGALYHAVRELGHDVEIINYVSDSVIHRQKRKTTVKSVLIQIASALFIKSGGPSFQEFESKMKTFPPTPTCAEEDLKEIAARYDRIIVGSDQVWNPVVTGHDMNFYLAFCKDNAKKASYAASFGYAYVERTEEEEIAKLLSDFAYLGVRERQGQQIVKNLTGRDASVVLDPTLLVSDKYLYDQMVPSGRKGKYVLFFCIKPSPKLKARAELYAKENGMDLVTVGGRIKDRFDPRKNPVYGIGPKEFLGLIHDADCVFTNSFHGTAVSVALHSDFFVEYSSDTNSRLMNLVEMLELQDRVAGENKLVNRAIDYQKVDRILQVQRGYSMKYLESILAEDR